jgi:hypothetical protein
VAQRIDDLTGLDCRRHHHLSELLLAADCRNGSPQVGVGMPEGLKHDSAIQCDGLVSLEKARLITRAKLRLRDATTVRGSALRAPK